MHGMRKLIDSQTDRTRNCQPELSAAQSYNERRICGLTTFLHPGMALSGTASEALVCVQHFFDERRAIPEVYTEVGPMPNEHILRIRALIDHALDRKDVMESFEKALVRTREILWDQDPLKMYDLMVHGAENSLAAGKIQLSSGSVLM